MQIISSYKQASGAPCVLCIGNFDGVHLGHRKLIEFTKLKAQELGIESALMTFWPHPAQVFNKNKVFEFILTQKQKERSIEKLGIDLYLRQAFDTDFASLSSARFIAEVLVGSLNAQVVVVGENFKFGKGAKGDVIVLSKALQERGVSCFPQSLVREEGDIISSSRIRSLLEEGSLDKANKCLGGSYQISGKVVHGNKRGRALGFPTANIETHQNMLPPGVYATRFNLDECSYDSVTNIGNRPTFDDSSSEFLVESHLLLLKDQHFFYGKEVQIDFIKRLRDEIAFETKEALIEQIKRDVDLANQILA